MEKILITGCAGFISINIGIALNNMGFDKELIGNFYHKKSKKNLKFKKFLKKIDYQKISRLNQKRSNFYYFKRYKGADLSGI